MVKFSDLISESFEWTKKVLFDPFSLKKWIILGFIAWLAGTLGGGLNINQSGGRPGSYKQEQAETQQEQTLKEGEFEDETIVVEDENGQQHRVCPLNKEKDFLPGDLPVTAIVLLVVLFIGVVILFSWLQGRFAFIFLEDVVENDASIKAPFRRYAELGNSLFLFHMAYALALVITIAILTVPFLTSMAGMPESADAGSYILQNISTIIIPAIIGLLVILPIVLFIGVLDQDILVPVMQKDNIKVISGWRKVFNIVSQNKKNFFIYILLKIGLGICASIIYLIAFVVLFIGFLIIGGLLGLVFYGIWNALPQAAQGPYMIIIVTFFVVLGIVALFLCLIAGLPIAVFFRTFSVKFLAAMRKEYDFFPVRVIEQRELPENPPGQFNFGRGT